MSIFSEMQEVVRDFKNEVSNASIIFNQGAGGEYIVPGIFNFTTQNIDNGDHSQLLKIFSVSISQLDYGSDGGIPAECGAPDSLCGLMVCSAGDLRTAPKKNDKLHIDAIQYKIVEIIQDDTLLIDVLQLARI